MNLKDVKHRIDHYFENICSDCLRSKSLNLNFKKVDIDKENKPIILICDCSSREHQIIMEHDQEYGVVYCHIFLTKKNFLKRLKQGVRYIFGYKCKFGQWEEFVLTEKHSDDILNLYNLLNYKK